MNKRMFQILLLMFLTVCILIGCGTNDQEQVQDDIDDVSKLEVEEVLDEDSELEEEEFSTESSEEETNNNDVEHVEQLEDVEVVLSSNKSEQEQTNESSPEQNEPVTEKAEENQQSNSHSDSSSRSSSSNSTSSEKKTESSSSKSTNDSSKKNESSSEKKSTSESSSKQKDDKKKDSSSSKKEKETKSQEEQAPASEPTVSIVINGPSDQGKLGEGEVKYSDGDTVLDILLKFGQTNSIQIDYTGRGATAYVQGISNFYEFDYGPRSGWVVMVNGTSISQSAGITAVKAGDRVVWEYTEG
ncbi:DUF4430 domain-containing protein [Bacillus sp. JCM 19034]|uniref:DUF4430 domain-containing protein n=1 Tax=Bacillus sp. JCM 19034 TaxID=1481928 RepID=UPI000783D817|nr:DUF4430 domain-containing protein [Bacillus sp. JCM 19034]